MVESAVGLVPGNRVLVLAGEATGMVGVLAAVVGNRAHVTTDKGWRTHYGLPELIEVAISDVRIKDWSTTRGPPSRRTRRS